MAIELMIHGRFREMDRPSLRLPEIVHLRGYLPSNDAHHFEVRHHRKPIDPKVILWTMSKGTTPSAID